MRRFIRDFGPAYFATDGDFLTCKVCEKVVNAEKKFFVEQHVKSAQHQNRLQTPGRSNQNVCLLSDFLNLSNKQSPSNMDLCQMLRGTNIPLFKVQNQSFRNCLEKYSKYQVPEHTTLRKTYLRKLYDATILKIRTAIGENPIWISMDETTDGKGRYVVNTIIGRQANASQLNAKMGCLLSGLSPEKDHK
ncbi:uncharacterized protein LOC108863739 [Galendromus occidentalis]|uniref:Uncharacterized protein LOC108863739 n=1 Tax=Galendromus occidentalis TaxID=34638 RepID=A0AAJ7P928_9ACAR|nr:uncharacterized protein LOC108863739 [Galendromus occidentalis]